MDGKRYFLDSLSSIEGIDQMLAGMRSEGFDVCETLDLLTEQEHELAWASLLDVLNPSIEALTSEEITELGDLEDHVTRVKRIASLSHTVLEKTKYRPESLLTVIECMHDMLIPLEDAIPGAPALKVTISRVCELMFTQADSRCENVITQLIPFLLLTALGPASLDADIKRVFNIRKALLLLDFEDESIESIKDLLLRCYLHSSFLKVSEGKRFLAFLLTVDMSLHPFIVGVMKPQLVSGSRTVATSYGDILLKAWKDTQILGVAETPVSRQSIEEGVIQGFIHEAIHASDRKYFKALRYLLGSFHMDKKSRDVDPMLLRVYGPIMWRSLQCANSFVRAQACTIFFDTFPLNDPSMPIAEDEALKQKQFDLINALLNDGNHLVRGAAASGVCRVLREYWECIPIHVVKHVLKHVICTLGQDSSCAGVRYAVCLGISDLLENPLSHGILRALLPSMKFSLHDTSEKVRIEFVRLLCKVKDIKSIQFYDIVSEEDLLLRLAADADRPTMSSVMTELLMNSFFPRGEKGTSPEEKLEQIHRCFVFLKKNEKAAITFYGHLSKHTSSATVARFACLLFVYLLEPDAGLIMPIEKDAETEGSTSKKAHPLVARAKRRREVEAKKTVTATKIKDFDLVRGILAVVLSSFSSIAGNLSDKLAEFIVGQISLDYVQKVFSVLSSFDSEDAVVALPLLTETCAILANINGWGALSPDTIFDNFVQNVSAIHDMHDKSLQERQSLIVANAAATAEMLCVLNTQETILTTLKRAIDGSAVDSNEALTFAPLELFGALFESQKPILVKFRNILLVKPETIGILTDILEIAKSRVESSSLLESGNGDDNMLISLRTIHLCINALVLSHKLQPELSTEISVRSVFSWFNNCILPSLAKSNVVGAGFETCVASPSTISKFSGVMQMEEQHHMSMSFSAAVSLKLLGVLVATICDGILCEHQLSVFEESILLWSTVAKGSPSAKLMMPSMSKLCFTLIAGKETKDKEYLRLSLVLLQLIMSFEYTSDPTYTPVMKNLQLILGFAYSRKTDEKSIFKMVLENMLNSMTSVEFDELDAASPVFFYLSILQYPSVLTRAVNWLSDALLLALQSSPIITGCDPEKVAMLISHLVKGKPSPTLAKLVQVSIQQTIAVEVNKENFTVSTQLKPAARKASKRDQHLHTDDIQRRVVSILQDSIANME